MYEFMYHLRLKPGLDRDLELYENGFFPVDLSDIETLDAALYGKLPTQLRQFYTEVGWGRLQTGKGGQHTTSPNDVASPLETLEILQLKSDWLMPYSVLEPNTLPFFQRDVDLFLCLHPQSENPNAVYWMWGEKLPNGGMICDSLVDFFKRLVEDPDWFNPPKPQK